MKNKNKYQITEKNLNELKKIIDSSTKEVDVRLKPILFDGVQYSIRIPKKFVEAAHINIDKDKFKFELDIPADRSQLPIIRGALERG